MAKKTKDILERKGLPKRTFFVTETYDENGVDIVRISADGELRNALDEAHAIYERDVNSGERAAYASVWGVYAQNLQEAIDGDAYVRVWSSAEDPELTLPRP